MKPALIIKEQEQAREKMQEGGNETNYSEGNIQNTMRKPAQKPIDISSLALAVYFYPGTRIAFSKKPVPPLGIRGSGKW